MVGKFGSPNATGRSSGKRSGRDRKLFGPPDGGSWVWLTQELLASPAMNALSKTGHRLLHFLLIEHTKHAGRGNGTLMATHDQLIDFGLNRNRITKAIRELVFLGLVKVERGRVTWDGVKAPNLFRLTFYVDSEGRPATNEWKGVTDEDIASRKLKRGKSNGQATGP